MVKALRAPDMGERLAAQGVDIIAGSPARFAAHIEAGLVRWAKVIKAAGVGRAARRGTVR